MRNLIKPSQDHVKATPPVSETAAHPTARWSKCSSFREVFFLFFVEINKIHKSCLAHNVLWMRPKKKCRCHDTFKKKTALLQMGEALNVINITIADDAILGEGAHWMVWWKSCYDLHSHLTSVKLNTQQFSPPSEHHQNTKWGVMFWKNGARLSSRAQRPGEYVWQGAVKLF